MNYPSAHCMTLIELTIVLAILAIAAAFTLNYAMDQLESGRQARYEKELRYVADTLTGERESQQISRYLADMGRYPESFDALRGNGVYLPRRAYTVNAISMQNDDIYSAAVFNALPWRKLVYTAGFAGPYLSQPFSGRVTLNYNAQNDSCVLVHEKGPRYTIDLPQSTLQLTLYADDATFGSRTRELLTAYAPGRVDTPWQQTDYNIGDELCINRVFYRCVALHYQVDSTSAVRPDFFYDYGRTFNDKRHLWQCVAPRPEHYTALFAVLVRPLATKTILPDYDLILPKNSYNGYLYFEPPAPGIYYLAAISYCEVGGKRVNFRIANWERLEVRPGSNTYTLNLKKDENVR